MDILTASIPTFILAFVLWLGKGLISTRLKESVSHEFNVRLERLKSELSKDSDQIRSVADMLLERLNFASTPAWQRKLQAVDELWQGFLEIKKYTWAARSLSIFKLDIVGERVEDDQDLREFFKTAHKSAKNDMEEILKSYRSAQVSRPWISTTSWAIFSAYGAIIQWSITTAMVLQIGVNPKGLLSTENIINLIKEALPDFELSDPVRAHHFYPEALDLLEKKLLVDLKDFIDGKSEDDDALERARRVLHSSSELLSQARHVSEKINESGNG